MRLLFQNAFVFFGIICLTTGVTTVKTSTASASELSSINSGEKSLLDTVIQDHKQFYSWRNMVTLGLGFGTFGIMANTKADQEILDWYQDDIRTSSLDDIAKIFKKVGEEDFLIPIALATAGASYFIPEDNTANPIGKWGMKTARSYLVGIPPLLLMQRVTGASRPGESRYQSDWDFFHDYNGVSGHAFIGAVPFMTVAGMTDNLFIKIFSYGASLACAWSRINDGAHYTSQAALGWLMALQATDSVFRTENSRKKVSFSVFPLNENGAGFLVNFSM